VPEDGALQQDGTLNGQPCPLRVGVEVRVSHLFAFDVPGQWPAVGAQLRCVWVSDNSFMLDCLALLVLQIDGRLEIESQWPWSLHDVMMT
jgi:hypothetical protein